MIFVTVSNELYIGRWLAGKESQSARESNGVFSHRIRKSSAKKRGACEPRNGIAGPGTIVKTGKNREAEGMDWATQGASLAGQGHDGISSPVSPL